MHWSFTAFLSATKPNLHTQHISHSLSRFFLCCDGDMGIGVMVSRVILNSQNGSLDIHMVQTNLAGESEVMVALLERYRVTFDTAYLQESIHRAEQMAEYPTDDIQVLLKTEGNTEILVQCAPFVQDYPIPETGAVYYLCENGACKAPVKSFSELGL